MAPKKGGVGVVAHPPTKKLNKGDLPPIPAGKARVIVKVVLAPRNPPNDVPITGVSVEITGVFGNVRGDSKTGAKFTNKDGEVTTHAFDPGTFQFLAFKTGFGPVPNLETDPFVKDANVVESIPVTAGENLVTIQMSDGTGVLQVSVVRTDLKTAIADCDVRDIGSNKTGKTAATGLVELRGIPAGKRDIQARKVGFGPDKTPFQFGPGTPEVEVVVAAGRKKQTRVILTADTTTVTRIKAKVTATKTLRAPALSAALADNTLPSSVIDSEDLTVNPPVILIRGCTKVELEVEMSSAGKPADWAVKPNQNTNAAPTITPTDGGKKAQLDTNKTGSFSVIAASGDSRKVWTVVFVFVDVKATTSVIVKRNTGYKDGTGPGSPSTAGFTGFRSGEFIFGQQAMESTVEVELTGGGTSKDIGLTPIKVVGNYLHVGKVNLHVLQNGVRDTLQGVYPGTPNGTGTETPSASVPILDGQGPGTALANTTTIKSSLDGSPATTLNGTASPFAMTNAVFQISKISARRIQLKFGDSPAGAFARRHPNPAKARLANIQGENGFRTAVASASQDAVNAVVVHAEFRWEAVYDGNVTYPSAAAAAVGTYIKTTAHTNAPLHYALVSPATGGNDAGSAGYELFEPRFNKGATTTFA